MIYSNNTGITTDRILTEVAKFQPSATVPSSLKKTVIGVCNNILNKSKKLDREDTKVDRALKAVEGAIALAKNNSYTDNAYPVEIHSAITGGEACMDYTVSVVRTMGFKHSNMKEGKKGQTWYKVSGNDILIATIVGTLFGNSMVTIIMHAVENSDHNNDILNGILESTVLAEGQQAEEYKARKTAESIVQTKNARSDYEKYNHSKGSRYVTGASSLKIDSHGRKKMNSADADRYGRSYTKTEDELNRRGEKSNETLSDKDNANYENLYYNFGQARDAINRHMRRHPKQYKEGTIFESIEFI